MKSKLQPLVDGDILVYRCGLASKEPEPLSYTLHSVKETLSGILSAFEAPETAQVFLQGQHNYRDRVATILPYKGNRDPSKRPIYFDEIRLYLQEYWGAQLCHGRETDDMLGITQYAHKDKSTCIVSIDKDLMMIPGYHYNWVKKELEYVTMQQANIHFFMQALMGDRTDNIQGIPKVGVKTAEKILATTDYTWNEMYLRVQQEYRNKFGSEWLKHFHENLTLLWIQRKAWENYDGSRIEHEEDEDTSVPSVSGVEHE